MSRPQLDRPEQVVFYPLFIISQLVSGRISFRAPAARKLDGLNGLEQQEWLKGNGANAWFSSGDSPLT
jgi:hypothetical protein